MKHRLTLVTAALLMLIGATGVADSGTHAVAAPGAHANVRSDVPAALDRQPWVRVIATLGEPAALRRGGPLDRAALKREIGDTQRRALAGLDANDLQLTHQYEGVSAIAGLVSKRGLQKLAADPDVTDVTLDGVGTAADAESLPLINADSAQALGYTGTGVTAAVIDSGVDLNNVDLSDDIVVQECFQALGGCPVTGTTRASGPGAAQDDLGHGTNVTGIITSKGTVAPIGVAPNVKIAAYKALNSNDIGTFADWTAALSDIIANHPNVKLVNMSLQSLENLIGACDSFQPATTSAINTLRAAGTLTFVASGNHEQKHGMTYPACISSAVAVGAVWDANLGSQSFLNCTDPVTSADRVTCFSNSDSTLDLLGPGAYITSTGLGGPLSTYGGTSQASPHAVGTAALLLEANPAMTPDQVEFRLKTTGKGVTDLANARTTPRIDALNAINPVDTDGDGMPNAYEGWHSCLNPLVADATADPDGDGIATSSEFAAGLDPCTPDSDGDGCADSEELGSAPLAGGDRDPLNPWDVFDVPSPALSAANPGGVRNKVVSIQDVIAVVFYIGTTAGGVTNANGANYNGDYNANGVPDGAEYDRSPSSNPAKPWRSGPPNRVVSIGDALIGLNQIGTNCTPAP